MKTGHLLSNAFNLSVIGRPFLWYKMEWNKMEWNGIKWNGNGMKWKMGHGVEFKNHLRILSSKFTN